MKDFSKATPRPWKMNKGEAWTKQIAIIDPVRNHYLCTIGKRFDNAEANAELIITAVNNFDKMKAFIEGIVNQIESQGREGCTYGDTEYDSLSAAYGYNSCLSELRSDAVKLLESLK